MSQRKYGAILSYVEIFFTVIIGLILTPFLVRMLGKEAYGIYVMLLAFSGFFILLELGLRDAIIIHVARCRAHNDNKEEANFLATIFIIYTGLTLLIAILGLIAYIYFDTLFGQSINAHELASTKHMFAILVGNVMLTLFFNPISATIWAYEHFIFLRTLEILAHILSTIAIIIALQLGYHTLMIIIITVVMNIVTIIAKVIYAILKLNIRMQIYRFDWPYIKNIFHSSLSVFVTGLVEQINWKLDYIILGMMLTPSSVAVYSIGVSFRKYLMSFGRALSRVMVSKIVHKVELEESTKELTDIFITISRLQAIILLLVLSGLLLFGKTFIILWVGSDFELAYYIIWVTLLPYTLELIGSVRNDILLAKNLYWYRALVTFIMALLNIAATFILVTIWGILGAAIATGISILLTYVTLHHIMQSKAGLQMQRYASETATGLFPALMLSVTIGIAINQIHGDSWAILGIKIVLYSIIYAGNMWWIGFNNHEKKLFLSLIPKYRSSN